LFYYSGKITDPRRVFYNNRFKITVCIPQPEYALENLKHAEMKTIKGQQVILRPATPADRRKIFEWLTQSDLSSRMIGPPDFPDNPIPDWEFFVNDYNPHFFDDIDPDKGRSFIIEINGGEVGHINYNEINRNTDSVELDIWLSGSKQCNKGYGTDAINSLCHYLTDHLNCRVFILAPSARNKAAVRAYEKCGFQPTTELPENFIPDYHDTVIMMKKISDEA
jgi:RimJ/RimL family protein N-acetyltransferase